MKDTCKVCGKALKGYRYERMSMCETCGRAWNTARCVRYQNKRYSTDKAFKEARKLNNAIQWLNRQKKGKA